MRGMKTELAVSGAAKRSAPPAFAFPSLGGFQTFLDGPFVDPPIRGGVWLPAGFILVRSAELAFPF